VSRLSDGRRRLTELSNGGVDLVVMVNGVWQRLSPPARRLLCRVSVLGDAGFPSRTCASLLDIAGQDADDALSELLDAGLLDVERRDGQVVFHLRGLLRGSPGSGWRPGGLLSAPTSAPPGRPDPAREGADPVRP
jgi:hypothetical protein